MAEVLIPPHEHCWHDFTSQVIRPGKNVHGPYCVTHPDTGKTRHNAKGEHEHLIIVHKQRCCRCPANRVSYEESVDAGKAY